MDLDPLILSRIQFGFTISWHIIFPAFTIGLATWLATMEGMWLATGNPVYRPLFDFWIKIFAVSFGMGVVTGIVMAFQVGTNWSVLAEKTGPIQGPLLGYETFTAFLLEAAFLGVILVGRDRVSPRLSVERTMMSWQRNRDSVDRLRLRDRPVFQPSATDPRSPSRVSSDCARISWDGADFMRHPGARHFALAVLVDAPLYVGRAVHANRRNETRGDAIAGHCDRHSAHRHWRLRLLCRAAAPGVVPRLMPSLVAPIAGARIETSGRIPSAQTASCRSHCGAAD
jgi:hypothetical protein